MEKSHERYLTREGLKIDILDHIKNMKIPDGGSDELYNGIRIGYANALKDIKEYIENL